MLDLIVSFLAAMGAFIRCRTDIALEILALRQQVSVLKRKRPRPSLNFLNRFFWTTLRQIWPRWSDVLVVKPETVVGWHRAGFRRFWRWKSRRLGGRPKVSEEIRTLIRRRAMENPQWGAPKIHGELLKLGFQISERTVARYLLGAKRRNDPHKHWLAFLANHREVIVGMDFFTVPTLTFRLLYCFFVIEHGRRRILHSNVTAHPTADGSPNSCEKRFPALVRIVMSSWATIRSLAPMWSRSYRRPAWSRSVPVFGHPGRTELPSGGSEAVAAKSWTTSSRSMNVTYAD